MKLLACAGVLLLLGCAAPRRKEVGLVQLPSAKDVEIERLTKENQEMQMELAELTRNCSAVLRMFKEASLKVTDPKAKEK